jgi:uncharacterized protein YndB with AHSA1/START domain
MDILHDLYVLADTDDVFRAISTPEGLDRWWTRTSAGVAESGADWDLGFGPDHPWKGRVTRCRPPHEFELQLTEAASDWLGTRVGFELRSASGGTSVRFYHAGWAEASEHCRISSFCWAMYLRVLRRFLEHGETVPYEDRLAV